MNVLLDRAFRYIVKTGSLTVSDAAGKKRVYGDGSGEPLAISFASRTAPLKIAVDADGFFGEAYMNGDLIVEQGSIRDIIELLFANMAGRRAPATIRYADYLRKALKYIHQYNPARRARHNVAHHYDLNGALYDLFLDRDRQYSCAYFERDDVSLEEAQLAKKRHIAAKLRIEPGMRVLDIGSGWGGLGLYLAETCGAHVTGVTLSEEQHKLSNERARQRGVADRIKFQLLDYRSLDSSFDRIVSVGMFEHVGVVHYGQFFRKLRELLRDNGIALVHSIGRSDGPGATSKWIKKYIFPGGYIPALSEVLPRVERAGLYVSDIEILRLHYAETLREWGRRFADNRDRAKAVYDERFCKMWEFYLATSEMAFRHQGMNNFQIQIVRNQHALPMTRNYMQAEEERLSAIDCKQPRLKSVPAE